jgi:aspartate 4-decarboxylase
MNAVLSDDVSVLREFEKLSPFEIKDALISLASESAKKSAAVLLNAGRGNPNWTATTPREGFFLLGQWAIQECKRNLDLPDIGGMPERHGIAQRFDAFLSQHDHEPGAKFLADAIHFAIEKFAFDPDAFVHELADSAIGDNYPLPDRFLAHAEQICHEYLMWAMCGSTPPSGKFDLFAVEGGTAAMCYVFKSLAENRVLRKGDTIALGTPIFTPYLEIPHLNDYQLNVISIAGDRQFRFSDAELMKLADPAVKMFLLVNPGNPVAYEVGRDVTESLVRLVKTTRPDLLILTDDVYGTFVPHFRSLMAELPHNTIGVYSYSKYFGCTGWRLGVIAMHEKHVIDDLIGRLPAKDHDALKRRYRPLTVHPEHLKFIDRLVADSRDVALNHTAGLSLPQQLMMTLFSLFALMDSGVYQAQCRKILRDRLQATLHGLNVERTFGDNYTAYYGIVDLEYWLRQNVGDDVVQFIKENYHPLDIVYRLAADHSIVLLNGGGFDAPDWSVRISFANLPQDAYENIGRALRAVSRSYVEAHRFAVSNGRGKRGKK